MSVVIADATYYTVKEAAGFLDVSESRVLQFLHEGRLKAQKIGRPWYINYTDLIQFRKKPRLSGNHTGRPRVKQAQAN